MNVPSPSLFTSLSAHSNTTLIVGANFSLVNNPDLDRSNTSGRCNRQTRDVLKRCIVSAMVGALNTPPLKRTPTSHQSTTLIPVLTSSNLADLPHTQTHPIPTSEHAPVSLIDHDD